VIESIETLKGRGPQDLLDVSRELTARMFVLGGLDASLDAARTRFDQILSSGAALQKFAEIIEFQGGDPRVLEDYSRLPSAGHEESVVAWQEGYVAALEAEALGRASMRLGAGRERMDSVIDRAVGLVFEKKVGDAVNTGDRICTIYANERSFLPEVREAIRSATRIGADPVKPSALVLGHVP